MSTISRHLSVMRSAGLVDCRKEGLWVHYRLRPEALRHLQECLEALARGTPSAKARGTSRCR